MPDMRTLDDVAIFWDYGMVSYLIQSRPVDQRALVENCPTPSNITGLTIANNIFALASHFGSVKLFKAYLEIAELPVSRCAAIRSELQCSGISLVDCPHNGRKDVADKMMLG